MSSKKYYYQSYKESYSKEFEFILKSSKGQDFAFCVPCRSDFRIAHGGRNDIVAHASTKKHKSSCSAVGNNQKLDAFVKSNDSHEKAVTNAECLFTAFLIEHNLPLSCADHAGQLFRKMFTDSKIAKSYGCARTKTSAIVREIALKKEANVKEALQNSPYTISVDGSNDSDSKLYPIVVNFFNQMNSVNQEAKVECVLLSLPVLSGNATGVNIGDLILTNLKSLGIPIKNCIALSCDNAPVMVGQKSGVISVLQKENKNIALLGCCCHLLNLAAEKGSSALPFKIDELLVDVFYYLEKSSKRKERLRELQKLNDTEVRKILKHVCTRWLSVGKCLNRLIEQWEPLTSFFKEECSKTNSSSSLACYKIPKKCKDSEVKSSKVSTQSSNKKRPLAEEYAFNKGSNSGIISREERIFYFLSNNLNKAYCLFLINIVTKFDSVNKYLQSESPQIHALRSVLLEFTKDLLVRFVKPSVLQDNQSCLNFLLTGNYNSPCNHKNDSNIIIGNGASSIVDSLSESEKQGFYKSVKKYFCTICDYIRLKFPLQDELLINASVADANKIMDASFSKVKYFIERYPFMLPVGMEKNAATDLLQEEFCELQINKDVVESSKNERMDKQWILIGEKKCETGKMKYQNISKFMLSLLSLTHSNAECERVFSQVKKTRTQFRSSLSEEMLEKIIQADYFLKGQKCFEIVFDSDFLKKAKKCTYQALKN